MLWNHLIAVGQFVCKKSVYYRNVRYSNLYYIGDATRARSSSRMTLLGQSRKEDQNPKTLIVNRKHTTRIGLGGSRGRLLELWQKPEADGKTMSKR